MGTSEHKFVVGPPRSLRPDEKDFLQELLRHGEGGNSIISELEDCLVQDMNDGGMGSLRVLSYQIGRQFGGTIVEAQFLDRDGVLVSAATTVDQHGKLFELDIWKVDFSSLLELPKSENIVFQPLGNPRHLRA